MSNTTIETSAVPAACCGPTCCDGQGRAAGGGTPGYDDRAMPGREQIHTPRAPERSVRRHSRHRRRTLRR